GTLDGANTPDSARPFGRILNNTIVGDGSGTGINVALNASTTLMNNVFANLGTGVSVDGTSVSDASNEKLTEIDTSAFYLVGTEVSGAAQKNGITLTESPFVDIANGNFYPTSPTKIVDSGMDTIIDRQPSIVEKAAIGIPQSPIETPNADLYGQRRADDPDQATDVGFGGDEVFKDRGAIERVDRFAPTVRLITPLDQGGFGQLVDEDNDLDEVRLQGREARGVQQFVIQISDVGVGVDKSSIVTAAVEVSRNGVALVDGVDYFFQFNANTNQIILSSLVVYELGDYTIKLRPDTQQGLLQDLAGNALFSNAQDSEGRYTSFVIELADVPSVPSMLTAVAGDDKVILDWNASVTSPSAPVEKYFIEFRDSVDGGATWNAWSTDSVDASVKADGNLELPVVDNTLREYRVFAQNMVGVGPKTDAVRATPSSPLNVTGIIGLENAVQAGQVSLDWDVPVNHGGFEPTHYVVDRIEQSDSILASSAGSRGALSADGLTFAYFSTSDELKIYDTSTTTAPVLLGSWPAVVLATADSASNVSSIMLDDTTGITPGMGVTGTGIPLGVTVLSNNSSTEITLSAQVTLSQGTALEFTPSVGFAGKDVLLSADGSLAYMVQEAGLSIIEISDPSAIAAKGSWLGANGAEAAILTNASDYAILSTGEVIDVTDVEQPVYAGSIGDTWIAAEVVGDQLFTISGANELKIYDISTPTTPVFVSTYVTDGTARDLAVVGDTLYVADDTNGLIVLDVTNSVSPVLQGEVNVSSAAEKVVVRQQKAYVANSDGTLSIYDVSDVTNIDTIDKRLVNGRSDLLISTTGSVLVTVGESSDGNIYIVDTAASWTRINETPVDTAVVVESLIKGVPQYFRVAAVNESGQGAWSEYSSLLVPEGVPDAPVNFTATINQTNGSIDLAWEAPLYDGGETITSYTIALQDDENVTEIPNLDSAVFAHNLVDLGVSLSRGTTYTFKVKAHNAYGGEDWSTEVTLTTPDVPQTAPAIPTVTALANSIRIDWAGITVPTGGMPVVEYVIQKTLDNGVNWETVADSDGILDDTSATVTGLLRNDGPHRFQVAGKNLLAGVSDDQLIYSPSSNPVTPFGLPSDVQGLVGNPGDGEATLSWTAPIDDGGTPVTDYRVEYKLTADTTWSVFNDPVSSTPGVTVTGLSNGIAYDFRVSAETLVGSGTAAIVNNIMPFGVPFAPISLTANPGTKSMALNWSEPLNGGSAITGYAIEYRKEIETVWTVIQHNSLVETYDLTDLDVAEYAFRVAAINGQGTGVYSLQVQATPYGPPAQPTNLEFVTDETGSLQTLSWSSSVSNAPDSPSYEVRYRVAEGASWNTVTDVNDKDESINLSSLNLGDDNYEFEITATTSSGSSSPLSIVTLADLQAVRGNRNVSLSWDSESVSDVIDFIIESKNLTENGDWETLADSVSPTSSAVVGNLINGDSYSFRIKTVLASGVGVVMTIGPVVPAGVPAVPNDLTATLVSSTGPVQLSWKSPVSDNGSTITDFVIEYATSPVWPGTVIEDGVSLATSATIASEDLVIGVPLSIRVAAINSVGIGAFTLGTTPLTIVGPPGPPTGLSGTASMDGSIALSWAAPNNRGGLTIQDYVVEYKSASGAWVTFADDVSASTTASVTGLSAADGPYLFRVAAQNSAGTGIASAQSSPVTPVATASAVEALIVDLASGAATLSWQPPESNGGATMTGYQIDYKLSSDTSWIEHLTADVSVLSTTISVTNGVEYDYRVTAMTGVGLGEPSVLSGYMSVGNPSAPTGLQVSSGSSSQAFLNWQAPADTGGGDITNYVVQYRLQNLASPAAWTTSSTFTTGTTAQVSGLATGSIYEFRVA
ncbi:MAG: fibronectin type III domain-containing protein, partial [Pirellulales bacterium]